MASHARPRTSRARGSSVAALPAGLRLGFVAAAAGAALAASAASANASPAGSGLPTPVGDLDTTALSDPGGAVRVGLRHGLAGVAGPVKSLQLDPLANTGADPLDNHVGTQVADFRSVGTRDVTGPVTQGASLDDLPLAGPGVRMLPGGRPD
jgi:hypothetical protein